MAASREIALDRRWRRLKTLQWPWRISQQGNAYTIVRNHILVVRVDAARGLWRCAYRRETAPATDWNSSGYVFATEEEAKAWGLWKVAAIVLSESGTSDPLPPVVRRKIRLGDATAGSE
jgi:hypothetical protein